jgi:hypothetical protein
MYQVRQAPHDDGEEGGDLAQALVFGEIGGDRSGRVEQSSMLLVE